jgi:alpha/beta superfamily hydrolase
LRECRKPVLFVHGERDEFGDVAKLQALVAELPPEAHARVAVIAGAGHFFDEQLDELSRVIREWVEETMNAER